jgi:hypothetical protein
MALIPDDSMAAGYSEQIREWLRGTTELRLLAKHEGRDATSVNAFIAAAKGRAKTLTFVETEDGRSTCGGYLDVAWVAGGFVSDPDRRSFIFTLKNHLGVPSTRFAQKRGCFAAHVKRDDCVDFGMKEGFVVSQHPWPLNGGYTYEAPVQGVALFDGGSVHGFLAGRWELWEVR